MPVGTKRQETIKHELKSLEGAWVELQQLSYDQMLERRDGATKMLMDGGRNNSANPQMALQIANKWSNLYSFPRCIVAHNITDEEGNLLDFKRPELVFKVLDPKLGAEIERLIDDLNSEADESEDFTPAQDSSSLDEQTGQPNGSEAS